MRAKHLQEQLVFCYGWNVECVGEGTYDEAEEVDSYQIMKCYMCHGKEFEFDPDF